MTALLRRTVLAASVAALALAALPQRGDGAAMHLRLTKSEPAKDSVVAKAPAEIKLWYSQKPQLRLSRVTLTGPSGEVATGAIVQDSVMLRAPITGAMPAGAYTVSWVTASSDGHPIRGTIPFRVGSGE
jgi:methionine-rich copper-binding protein CopC